MGRVEVFSSVEIKQENKIKAEKVKVNKESTEENSLFILGKKISNKDPILKNSMENVYKLDLPLKVDICEGRNWYESK